jgi:NAD(P)-dependent dehydrogenase (short-subunit alcohol dehydrogenase family)
VAVVTGANSGVGYETAGVLAARGATVVLACRDKARAEDAAERIAARAPGAMVGIVVLDLAELSSVRAAAGELKDRFARIDLLVANAGVLMPPRAVTVDGHEWQLAVNHLGHFALTGLLLDRIAGFAGARVVTVGSLGHVIGRIDFADLQRGRRYSRLGAYTQSKLANLLFASELQRRLAAAGAPAVSVAAHPGSSRTEIVRHIPWIHRALSPASALLQQPARIGALAVLRAAVDPSARGGECFGPRGPLQWRGYPEPVAVAARARDPEVARRLWAVSEQLTGVAYDL